METSSTDMFLFPLSFLLLELQRFLILANRDQYLYCVSLRTFALKLKWRHERIIKAAVSAVMAFHTTN